MSSNVTSLNVVVPQNLDSLRPITLKDNVSRLNAAYVERYAISNLPPEWDKATGCYVLLSHIQEDNKFIAYVGKTDYSFKVRLDDHNKKKDFWRLAVLFRRELSDPFSKGETSYFEGLLVDALKSSPNVRVTNSDMVFTGDRVFGEEDKAGMDGVLLAALRVLFLRGYRNAHMAQITSTLEKEEQQANPIPPVIIPEMLSTVTPEPVVPPAPGKRFSLFGSKKEAPVSVPAAPSLIGVPQKNTVSSSRAITDEELFAKLKAWRTAKAQELKYSPFVVCNDDTLRDIVNRKPRTQMDLLRVRGIGKDKANMYGAAILAIVNDF